MARFSDGGFRDCGGSTQWFVTVEGSEGVFGEDEAVGIYSCRVGEIGAMGDAALLGGELIIHFRVPSIRVVWRSRRA